MSLTRTAAPAKIAAKPVVKAVPVKATPKPRAKLDDFEDDETTAPLKATAKSSTKTAPKASVGRVVRDAEKKAAAINPEEIALEIANGLADFIPGDINVSQAKNKRTWIVKCEIPDSPKAKQVIELTVLVTKPDRIRVNLAMLNSNDVFNSGTRVFDVPKNVLDFAEAMADADIKSAMKVPTRIGKTHGNDED